MALSPFILESSFDGMCYPQDPAECQKQFASEIEKVSNPISVPSSFPLFPIVPHIDFRVNLSVYASVYETFRHLNSFPDLFIILGVGHHCWEELNCLYADFKTPLGTVPTDLDAWTALNQLCPFPIPSPPQGFIREHSLEYVVVWLQVLRDLYFPQKKFSVLPILMGGLQEEIMLGELPSQKSPFFQFGKALKQITKNHSSQKIAFISSIDGCHVGPRFGHPFQGNSKVQEKVKKWESQLWSLCHSKQLDSFFEHASENHNMFYFDGIGVLTCLLQHFELSAEIHRQTLWYEETDHSFVTFAGGVLLSS